MARKTANRMADNAASIGYQNGWNDAHQNYKTHIDELRAQLAMIVDHYELRSELFTNDADVAANLAAIARKALQNSPIT